MENVKIIVLIPVGPDCDESHVRDTVDSVQFYMKSSTRIILLDDSVHGIDGSRFLYAKGVEILRMPGCSGKKLGLYANLVEGFRYAFSRYNFEILLRLDTDALVIDSGSEEEASRIFLENPQIGMLGSYRIDCIGEQRDFKWVKSKIIQESRFGLFPPHPRQIMWAFFLRKTVNKALRNNYELGEFCQGSAVFMSSECVKRFSQYRLPSKKTLKCSEFCDDHFMGILVHSVGLENGDFATGSLPIGIRWEGLPCSPEMLIKRNKKIVHSVRYYQELDEKEIRAFYQKIRLRSQISHIK